MKILIVSYAYPPIISPGSMRISHFAKDLAQSGFDITVLTSEDGYSSMISEKKDDFKKFTQQKNLKIIRARDLINKKILNTGNKNLHTGFSIKKLLSKFIFPDRDITWYFPAIKKIKKTSSNFDIVLGSYPQVTNLLLASYLAKYFSSKLVIDMRDLWTDDENFKRKNFIRKKIECNIEKKLLRSANLITSVSNYNIEIIKRKSSNSKITLIHNGYDQDILSKLANSHIKKNKDFIIIYAGSFYGGERNPIPFLKALKKVKENKKDKKISLHIYGNIEGFLVDAVKKLNLKENIKFQGLLSQEELFVKLNQASLLLTITRTQSISKGELTTKTFEYIALKRPLLCLTKKGYEINDLLSSVPFAQCVDIDDHSAIAKALEKTIERKNISQEWQQFDSTLFSRQAASIKLKKCLKNLL